MKCREYHMAEIVRVFPPPEIGPDELPYGSMAYITEVVNDFILEIYSFDLDVKYCLHAAFLEPTGYKFKCAQRYQKLKRKEEWFWWHQFIFPIDDSDGIIEWPKSGAI